MSDGLLTKPVLGSSGVRQKRMDLCRRTIGEAGGMRAFKVCEATIMQVVEAGEWDAGGCYAVFCY